MDNIKKIIFDLDNTLILWKEEYIWAIEDSLKEFNINIDPKTIDSIIDELDSKYYILSKEQLLDNINSKCNLNLDMSFIDSLFDKQKNLAPYDEKLIDLLSYLSNKYELILYTNYFNEVQAGRLQTAGVLKYFNRVYGGDNIPVKPNIEGFEKIIGSDPKDIYLMIGDSMRCDVGGAQKFGIKVILCDYNNKYIDNNNLIVIKNIEELKEIL